MPLPTWLTPLLLVVEVAALTVAAWVLWRYRVSRAAGRQRGAGVEEALRAALPGAVATVVLHEVRSMHSLALWVRRRRHEVPSGASAFGYGRDGRALGLVLLAVSLVEVVAVELVVPWPAVRLGLLVLGIYGVVLVLGFLASAAVRPHVLTDEVLRLRCATWADVPVPLAAITAVHRRLRAAEGMVDLADGVLVLAPAGATSLEVVLDAPREVRAGRRSGPARIVRFSADDPTATAAAIAAAAARGAQAAAPDQRAT